MNEQKIREYIRRLLEEEEKPKKKKKSSKDITPGEIGLSVGRGGFTKIVADVGALAKKDPAQLMKNLGISSGGRGLQGVVTIWKQASKGSEPMKKAYGGISSQTKGSRQALVIGLGELNARNGAKFAHHTLKGAMAAGLLSSDVPLQIQVVGNDVIVHTGAKKGDWE
jgi:hypothetical protein